MSAAHPRPVRLAAPLLAGALAATLSAGPARATVEPAHVAAPAAADVSTAVTKVLVVVEENHSLRQMKKGMPYAYKLATRYGYATRYHAVTHPSLPNYLAIAGGSTFGVDDDLPPADHALEGRSVFGQAVADGDSVRTYAQSMPGTCHLVNSGDYAVRHNPWTYFADERSACQDDDVPFSRFAADAADGTLPVLGLVIPDMEHDAHDGSLAVADRFFKRMMRKVFAGPDWQSGTLAVVLTADEDDHSQGNRVLTMVVHPALDAKVVKRRLGHYALSRSLSEVVGRAPLRKAKGARSVLKAFGLSPSSA